MNRKVRYILSLCLTAVMLFAAAFAVVSPDLFACVRAAQNDDIVVSHTCAAGPKAVDETASVKATCLRDGITVYVIRCTVCGKELDRETVTEPKIAAHEPGDKTVENVVAPTCKDEGSYNEVVRCKLCNTVISSTPVAVPKTTAHERGEAVRENVNPATCQQGGSYDEVIRCRICRQELQRTPKTLDKLSYHVSNYSVDGYANGKYRTCLDGEERCVYCNALISAPLEHTWGEGVITRPVTRTTMGEIVYHCTVEGCDATKTVVVPVSKFMLGDVDADGRITAEDARLVLRYAVGFGPVDGVISAKQTEDSFKAADYNESGAVDSADARLILRASVGLAD